MGWVILRLYQQRKPLSLELFPYQQLLTGCLEISGVWSKMSDSVKNTESGVWLQVGFGNQLGQDVTDTTFRLDDTYEKPRNQLSKLRRTTQSQEVSDILFQVGYKNSKGNPFHQAQITEFQRQSEILTLKQNLKTQLLHLPFCLSSM